MKVSNKYYLSLFGATGTIGNLTFDIIDSIKKRKFELFLLTANENINKMIFLIKKYNPLYVFMFNKDSNLKLKKLIHTIKKKDGNALQTKIINDNEQLLSLFKKNKKNHVFINGIMGYNGLVPTLIAQKYGYRLGLANKESIIILGEIQKKIKNIYPLDSEHFAIFKLLKSIKNEKVKTLIITSSGGRVHGISQEKIKKLKLEEILQHPTWSMGDKITIDSSTGMNKAFEVLEAHYLFNFPLKQIKVYINKNSNIHGIIITKDNTYYIQASSPDMHLSIYNFFSDIMNVKIDYNFNQIDFNSMNFVLKNVQYNKFKVLGYLYKNFNKIPNIGTKFIVLNDILLEKMINREIEFYQYNDLFFKIFKKIKNERLIFSNDEKIVILNLEKFRKKVESCFHKKF